MLTTVFVRSSQGVLALFLLLSLCAACMTPGPRNHAADIARGYTSDMVVSAGGATTTSRIMVQGGRMRMETLTGRRSSVLLVDYDQHKTWVLIPVDGKYKEVPFEALGDQIPHFFMPGLLMEKKTISEEVIDGVPAVRYHSTIICDDGQRYSGSLWESRDLPGFPLKWIDDSSNAVVTWRNVRAAGLLSSLFEIPPGYTELAGQLRMEAGRGKRFCRGVIP